jgi:hypothetical protein
MMSLQKMPEELSGATDPVRQRQDLAAITGGGRLGAGSDAYQRGAAAV